MSPLTPDQLAKPVEQRYTLKQAAELLTVTERTVHNYINLGKRTHGRDGIYPVEKLSHKVMVIPASSINRFLASRRVST